MRHLILGAALALMLHLSAQAQDAGDRDRDRLLAGAGRQLLQHQLPEHRPVHHDVGRASRDVGQPQLRSAAGDPVHPGDQLGQGKENARKFLSENPDIAKDIERVCDGQRLTAVVATHRHADHISGFGTDTRSGASGCTRQGGARRTRAAC